VQAEGKAVCWCQEHQGAWCSGRKTRQVCNGLTFGESCPELCFDNQTLLSPRIKVDEIQDRRIRADYLRTKGVLLVKLNVSCLSKEVDPGTACSR
jgi:hypothetical protein